MEYALLVTDHRSIFIRQMKTRRSFVLRFEIRIGTSLVTDVIPKTLEDYEKTSLETLTADSANLTIPHEAIISLALKAEEQKLRRRDFLLTLTMRMQKERFQVYNFEMKYRRSANQEVIIKFYMVPFGVYFKPRRQTQNRDTILREIRHGCTRDLPKGHPSHYHIHLASLIQILGGGPCLMRVRTFFFPF